MCALLHFYRNGLFFFMRKPKISKFIVSKTTINETYIGLTFINYEIFKHYGVPFCHIPG